MAAAADNRSDAVTPRLSRLHALAGPGREDRICLAGMALTVSLLHLIGFGILWGIVAPHRYSPHGGRQFLTVGMGVLAYTLGLRHAFDADHITAIDNTTRKLLSGGEYRGGKRHPLSAGFWFSLGHSTVVFALVVLLSLGVNSLAGQIEGGGSPLHAAAGIVGASVSGVFLWVIGLANLAALVRIAGVFARMRRGGVAEAELEEILDKRGLMNRWLGGLSRSVRAPWHLYPIGLLFGLGFDTATEVGLLMLAGGAAVVQLPLYIVIVLPILFAAGMSLMDSADGIVMTGAYGWACHRPVRKVFYNLTVTSISVLVALAIGTVELAGVIADRVHPHGGGLSFLAGIPLNGAGYGIVVLFVAVWLVSLAIWRFGRVEERWSGGAAAPGPD